MATTLKAGKHMGRILVTRMEVLRMCGKVNSADLVFRFLRNTSQLLLGLWKGSRGVEGIWKLGSTANTERSRKEMSPFPFPPSYLLVALNRKLVVKESGKVGLGVFVLCFFSLAACGIAWNLTHWTAREVPGNGVFYIPGEFGMTGFRKQAGDKQ